MCGIAGIIGYKKEENEQFLHAMTNVISHRGPDDLGHYVAEGFAMGMRRLSIIDVEGGKQPIASTNGDFVIVFNGEIYNYRALREELVLRGYQFKTETDTEVILHLFEAEGSACLSKLRGMFVFAILNKKTQELFIARDYFGIKPLYYFLEGSSIRAFGSEIKSILALPGVVRSVNDEAVVNYLSFQYNPLKETFFKGIWKLDPGSFLKIDLTTGKYKEERYWEFVFGENVEGDETECAQKLSAVLEDSVRHHMIADVPVGAFLSGGIDSGIIAALAQKERSAKRGLVAPGAGTQQDSLGSKIATFTIGFNEVSEAREARVTAKHIGTEHHESIISREEYFHELPKIMWHFDEPVADPAASSLYFLAREARKKVKVVLSGEGADELFGGYNIYLESYARRSLSFIPGIIRERVLRPLSESPRAFRGKNLLKRFFSNMEDWYIGNANIFTSQEAQALWKGTPHSRMKLAALYARVRDRQDSEKMQYVDINTWLVGDILAKADKMTMAHSLELRVPFLDVEVSNFARHLPLAFKWKNYTTKFLLRKVADQMLTPAIARRKKLGFPTPVGQWFDADQVTLYERITENDYIRTHFDIAIIKRIIADHVARRADHGRKIYLLLSLAIWHEVFFEDKHAFV